MTATLMPELERPDESPATTLGPVHDQWIERITRFLTPAMQPRATFWERWGVVRFLTDEFVARFRIERELTESLGDLLPPPLRWRLAADRVALEGTLAELMDAGRRWDTGPQVSLLARHFLNQARDWCATLEIATARMRPEDLPERSRKLLERLGSVPTEP